MVAAALIEKGASGQRVAFIANRTAGSYAAVLGILKAGAAYVPLHPGGPPARWTSMLRLAEVRFALNDIGVAVENVIRLPSLSEAQRSTSALHVAGEEAYVLFTSGSTGLPKGVCISNANVASYVEHMLAAYPFGVGERFTQYFALTFDLSVHDLFVCWGSGGCLFVPEEEGGLRAAAFARRNDIAVWFSVPSAASMAVRIRDLEPGTLPSLKLAFFCGEALPWTTAQAFAKAAPKARLINLYGPTESTIAITAYELDRSASERTGNVPIGKLFPGHMSLVENGELLVHGPQVAKGYINDPLRTDQVFVERNDARGKWYRTGDRVSVDPNGDLHFKGRIDDQVKILGHRVEPGEVDSVIRPLLVGGNCATVPVLIGSVLRLVTFIDVPADTLALFDACRTLLPSYMVPDRFIVVGSLPMTAHGKVDRKQLITLAENA